MWETGRAEVWKGLEKRSSMQRAASTNTGRRSTQHEQGIRSSWCGWWVKCKAGSSLVCWAGAVRATQGFSKGKFYIFTLQVGGSDYSEGKGGRETSEEATVWFG